MNPVHDHLLVAAIVTGALGFFLRRLLRKKKRAGCDSGCGCTSSKLGGAGKG